jgi:hypothetical protein
VPAGLCSVVSIRGFGEGGTGGREGGREGGRVTNEDVEMEEGGGRGCEREDAMLEV